VSRSFLERRRSQSDKAIGIPSSLSDEELVTEVRRLARLTRETTALLVAHLAEMETRRLYLAAGCPSLFVYCTDVLCLSEHEAYLRIEAARLARRFPLLLEMLKDGALTLTTAKLLSPQLSTENHDTLLAAAAGRSKREVEVLLARSFPLPDVPSSIRKVPAPRPQPITSATSERASVGAAAIGSLDARTVGSAEIRAAAPVAESSPGHTPCLTAPMGPLPSPPAKPREVIRPLAADRYEVRFTISAAGREKLRLATDLLRHAVPEGDTGDIVERALTALLEQLARKKFASTAQPRPARQAAPGTRHVPAHVRRTVWLRDGGRCAFMGKGNRRCPERGFLEFHHLRPYGVGGEATMDNIALRCRAHNAYESEWFYGRRFMQDGADKAGLELGPDRV
jgi:hypothetical protein